MTHIDLKAIAAQLRKPEGEFGSIVAKNMEIGNKAMIDFAFEQLELEDGDKLLEIGHGNGSHVGEWLNSKPSFEYYGIENSSLMYEEASQNNREDISKRCASFLYYSGKNLSYGDNYFDAVITINTIYFWDDPRHFINEMVRVLKADGSACICFAHRDSMVQFPFTAYGFHLYNVEDVVELLIECNIKAPTIHTSYDIVNNGVVEGVKRVFSAVLFKK